MRVLGFGAGVELWSLSGLSVHPYISRFPSPMAYVRPESAI